MIPPVTGCHLMIPSLCHADSIPDEFKKDYQSYAQLPNAAILSPKAMDLFVTKPHRSLLISLTDLAPPVHSERTMSRMQKI